MPPGLGSAPALDNIGGQDEEQFTSWTGALQRTTMVCDVTRGHAGVCLWSVLLPRAMMKPKIYVDILSLCLKPWRCPWAFLPWGGGGHVDMSGLCSHLRSNRGPWSTLPLRDMSESVVLIQPGAMLMALASAANRFSVMQ